MIDNYEQALAFIHNRPRFKKKPTLSRMKLLLHRLGDPQRGQNYIHVTGTNGKGSVVAMTRQILMEQGLNVGTFTSPFITRFNERIAINGCPISDDDLVKYTDLVAKEVTKLDHELPEGGPTEFEINTAIMFCYFADHDLDVVILEVGIGGLYDSTNVIKAPLVSAIVTVGYDHMKYLGNSLPEIARQKAGIIKDDCPVVVGDLDPSAQDVIDKVAHETGSKVFKPGKDYFFEVVSPQSLYATVNYSGISLAPDNYKLSLAGEYQAHNAGVAITIVQVVMKKLGISLDKRSIKRGLAHTKWPGRMELINEQPVIILDGAHNLPGIQALVKTIRDDLKNQEVYILVAILADKQYDLMLGELASLPNVHIFVTNFDGPYKGRKSADLSKIIQEIPSHYPIEIINNWQLGFAKIVHQMSEDDVLIVTGSLYFISDVRHLMTD